MKWTASAPVEWPTDATLAEFWARIRAEIDKEAPHADYSLDEHGDGWQLVRGVSGRPGSVYRFVSPRLTRARVGGRIDDDGVVRFELAGVPLRHGPTTATVVADGFDGPRHITSNGQIGPLKWDVHGAVAERRFQGRVSLPWIKGRISLHEQGGLLVGELNGRLTGVVGPLLNMITREFGGIDIQRALQETVDDLVGPITQIARGEVDLEPAEKKAKTPPPPPNHVPEFDAYASRLVAATRRLQAEMDHTGWYGRRKAAWRRKAADALPRVETSSPIAAEGIHLRVHIVNTLGEVGHSKRMRALDDIVTMTIPRFRAMVEESTPQEFVFAEPEPTNYDKMLDLDWLASLRGVVAHLTREDSA